VRPNTAVNIDEIAENDKLLALEGWDSGKAAWINGGRDTVTAEFARAWRGSARGGNSAA
jgi:hypothetical protein